MCPLQCFAGLDKDHSDPERSRIAVLPIPYDKTSTWIKGADKGPFAVIEASPALEFYDIETDSEVYRRGICTCPPLHLDCLPHVMVEMVRDKVAELAEAGKFTVIIGGEHSVSIGAVAALSKRYSGLSVLQLDAHSDLRDEYEGSKYNHACVAARFLESAPVVQVGVRSMDISEKAKRDQVSQFPALEVKLGGGWKDRVIERLSDDVYVTIDLDVFDPSVMPSTGTPEPGGLDWYEVTGLLKKVAEKKNVVGFDCVELCPNPQNRAPDFLAAKLIYTFLSYIFAKNHEAV